MPKPGYKRRFFQDNFKIKSAYEYLNHLKPADDIIDPNTGKKIGRVLLERWGTKFKDQLPPVLQASAYSLTPTMVKAAEPNDDILRELGRMVLENKRLKELVASRAEAPRVEYRRRASDKLDQARA